jgi:hypothetical protein
LTLFMIGRSVRIRKSYNDSPGLGSNPNAAGHGYSFKSWPMSSRIALSAGIVQLREPLKTCGPAIGGTNQTGPCWPRAQSAPIWSKSGLWANGCPTIQAAARSPQVVMSAP